MKEIRKNEGNYYKIRLEDNLRAISITLLTTDWAIAFQK